MPPFIKIQPNKLIRKYISKQPMRKFIAGIMIFSFVIAIFDVEDIYDLRHDDGTMLFSTNNPHADNAPDSLDDQGLEYTTVHDLFLPSILKVCLVKRIVLTGLAPQTSNTFFYNHIPAQEHRPPMA